MATTLRTRHERLWTSAEAATALRVGVSSIKRWSDDGELESVRTPGGHRRFTLHALHRFAAMRRMPLDFLPAADAEPELFPSPPELTLEQALIDGDADAVRRLIAPPASGLAQRAAYLDRVAGDALRDLGTRWQHGDLGIDEEHRASEIAAEAIDRLRPPLAHEGPLALLACPPGEWHDLPLRLVRLIFEWSGWRTEFAGANLPWCAVRAAVEHRKPDIVAFSARSGAPFVAPEFADFVTQCGELGVRVIAGGEWARGGTHAERAYQRFRSLRGLERWLRAG